MWEKTANCLLDYILFMQDPAYLTMYLQQVQRTFCFRSCVGVLLDTLTMCCSLRASSFFLCLGITDNDVLVCIVLIFTLYMLFVYVFIYFFAMLFNKFVYFVCATIILFATVWQNI
jgi:hypothetical protein